MTDPENAGGAEHHEGEPTYRRPNDHLVEPFFAGLPERDDLVEEAAPATPEPVEPRGTLRVVRAFWEVIVIRLKR